MIKYPQFYTQDNRLLIGPGDLVDKLSIIIIKLEKIQNEKQRQTIISELFLVTTLYIKIMLDHQKKLIKMDELFQQLMEVNLIQWDLENQVRVEQTGKAAYAARLNNEKRVEVKNKINRLMDYPFEEKEYQG